MASIGQSYTVTYECESGNEYDGRLGLRVSSIFVIGFGSLCGALLPIMAARTRRMRVPPLAFFITKYFGSGVIIATAFIHLLAPASSLLGSPCLTGAITEYDWAEGIALMTIFLMFFIELMAARFDVFGHKAHDIESASPTIAPSAQGEKYTDSNTRSQSASSEQSSSRQNSTTAQTTPQIQENDIALDVIDHSNASPESETAGEPSKTVPRSSVPGREDDFSYPPGGEDHLGHQRDHLTDADHFAAQMTAIFILEFGVIFHSIFIGLTLAVAGSNFNVLYIVLAFHQTFEGLGLGSRLATADWPRKKEWLPWALGIAYGLTTPIAIAIGLGVQVSLAPGSTTMMVVNGVFDAISAGILIYTGLVELMAHEFMFNPEMRKGPIKMMISAFLCMCLGAGLMALLGKWA